MALLLSDPDSPFKYPLVFIAGFGQTGRVTGVKLLHDIRKAGLMADTDFRASTLKALLRSADRLSAAFTVILGDDEAEKGTVILRDMRTKKQEELPLAKVVEGLFSLIKQATLSDQNS